MKGRHLLLLGDSAAVWSRAAPADLAADWDSRAGLWQESGKTTPAASNNDPVGNWVDQKSGLEIIQAVSGAKPTLKTSQINGLSALYNDGGDVLSRASTTLSTLFGNTAMTMYIVMSPAEVGNHGSFALETGAPGSNLVGWYNDWSGDFLFDYGDTGSGGRLTAAQPAGWDTVWHIVRLKRDGATGTIDVDGTSVIGASFTDDLDSSASGTLWIGKTSAANYRGYVARILIYNVALGSADDQLVIDYLDDLYGITWT